MPSAIAVVRKAAVKPERVVDSITLDHRARGDHHRDATTEKGVSLHIHLNEAGALKDGDALKLDDDTLVLVRAAVETLYEIRSDNAARLARVAWRLGGHHIAMEATAAALYAPADASLDELIRGLGVSFSRVMRPFEPERDAPHHHHHDHHDHGHGAQAHSHAGAHAHSHGRDHDKS